MLGISGTCKVNRHGGLLGLSRWGARRHRNLVTIAWRTPRLALVIGGRAEAEWRPGSGGSARRAERRVED